MRLFKCLLLIVLLSACYGGQIARMPIKTDRSQCKDKIGEKKEQCYKQVEALKESLKKHIKDKGK